MPDIKSVGTKIHTGPATSIKTSATNMDREAKKEIAQADARANSMPVKEGEVKYSTRGTPDFHLTGVLSFGASIYVTGDKEEQKALDDCVKRKLLNVVEDKRK